MSDKQEYTTSRQLSLFAADFLASLTVLPGSEEARQMTVISGRNIAGLLPISNPLTSLVKMCLESEQLSSTACYLTWRVWATPGKRLLFRLAPTTPPIGVTESGLLPTPVTVDSGALFNRSKSPNAKLRPTLGAMAKYNLWPTPRATDGNKGTRTLAGALAELERGRNRDLGMMVKLCSGDNADEKGGVGGKLNPEFVEWLMGFPIGWTDLEHSGTP